MTPFSLYSFTSELGLYALGRSAVASDAQAGREAYEAAKADRGRIEARLKELGPQRPAGTVQADLDAAKQGAAYGGAQRAARKPPGQPLARSALASKSSRVSWRALKRPSVFAGRMRSWRSSSQASILRP
jgi:hypothetical protein